MVAIGYDKPLLAAVYICSCMCMSMCIYVFVYVYKED
nr:MAG TPA_asm: hypothetical protein [Caudoviricetes sp.]